MIKIVLSVVCAVGLFRLVNGHGRLIKPESRSSLWRFQEENPLISPYGDLIESNYNDNQLFCGGASYQRSVGGKCGVCGDAYETSDPENVAGGKYAKGIIVRQYPEGSSIEVTVEITTYHKGFFEFRLCPWNNVTVPITHDCLNQHLLLVGTSGATKYDINNLESNFYNIDVQLPIGITCDQCVLQWRYHTGNTWGCDDMTGECGLGFGPQEEFYGCADIAIGTGEVVPPPSYQGSATSTESSNSQSSSTSTTTTSTSTTTTTTSPSTTTTSTTTQSGICSGDQNAVPTEDCGQYYQCINGVGYLQSCASGTAFNEAIEGCDHLYNVPPPCGTKE